MPKDHENDAMLKHFYKRFLSLLWLLTCSICFLPKASAQNCEANFSFAINEFTVEFIDQTEWDSTLAPLKHTWIFGDGSPVSHTPAPTHIYNNDGVFEACHIINDIQNFCSDTVCHTVYICPACVWPGDANRDGIVNNKDVLFVGIAYNAIGPLRPDTTTNFAPHPAYVWLGQNGPASFSGGLNYNNADCDGNGHVDKHDLQVISQNYNLHYPKSEGNDCLDLNSPPLYIQFQDDSVVVGANVSFKIKLGSNLLPANSMYGIAFMLHYDNAFIEQGSVSINYSNSALGVPDSLIFLNTDFHSSGKIETAVTRINQTGKNLVGNLGTVSFVMEDNLTPKNFLTEYLHFSFSDVYLIRQDQSTIPVCAFKDSLLAYEYLLSSNDQPADRRLSDTGENRIKVYPNPTTGQLYIQTPKDNGLQYVKLYNASGKAILSKQWLGEDVDSYDLSSLPEGIYLLQFFTEDHIQTLKIEIVR